MNDAFANEPAQTDWRRLLTPAERTVMLEDVASVALAAGAALFPDQPWSDLAVAAGSDLAHNSPIEQLGFVEARLPMLTQAARQITQSPLTSAAACAEAVLPQQARRVTAIAWMDHVRRGQAGRTVDETVPVLVYDTPENRAVKSFIRRLEQDCLVIAWLSEADEEGEAFERAMHCARHLHRLLPETLWREIAPKRGDWTQPPTQRETLRPDYACLARERTRYRKRFRFDWDHPLLTLPPRDTWRLYETWCVFAVLGRLRELGWRTMPEQDVLAVREGRLCVTLETGKRSRIGLRTAQGKPLSLTYNQTFAEGCESLSHAMQPDITLSDGDRRWILDAKFKPYAGPGEEGGDINQMHAYRDAIIGPNGTRNVASAWCLYAGLTDASNRSHITYGRTAETSVGALCLRPGNAETLSTLRLLLEQWLDSSQ